MLAIVRGAISNASNDRACCPQRRMLASGPTESFAPPHARPARPMLDSAAEESFVLETDSPSTDLIFAT